ncbi:MAG: iron-sulfur cluster assembly protein [Saprospiraceae bacterium]
MDKEAMKEAIVANIKTVFDPEIPVDIYELGLIYTIDIEDSGLVNLKMTLTSPMCPVADSLPMEVQRESSSGGRGNRCGLAVVFDPPWSKDMMSEKKLNLCSICFSSGFLSSSCHHFKAPIVFR